MTTYQFIAISGNIAVGKSTLTKALAAALGWQPFFEAFADNPYLADFYHDMERWSFHSQVFFLAKRLQHHRELFDYPGHVIQDRSVYEDAEIFARNLYLKGSMSQRDYECYQDLYQGIRAFLPPPTLVVYLHAPVEALIERITQRGRDYEQQIAPDYLQQIHTLYEEWADHWQASPLLRISALDYNFAESEEDLQHVTQRIVEALATV